MTTTSPSPRERLLLYPEPVRAPDVASAKREGVNPRIYGWLLVAAAFLMESFGFIRRGAWANAGFGRIRLIREYLLHTEPRYDPTVYPIEPLGPADTETAQTVKEVFDDDASQSQNFSVASYRSLYLSGELTPLDVAQAILPLIRRDTTPPGEHSIAFIEVHAHLVLKAAAASTLRYKEKRSLGPLDGVPTAVKDEFDMEGYRTSLGSSNDYATFQVFRDDPSHDNENVNSWCVRMAEDAGAIILGKLTLHEFGLDTSGLNTTYGTPRNPYNSSYYPGGSSSGPAYAVATGLVPATLGSDGGGSVRVPASFCSVFGLKPTHGRLSFLPAQNHSNTAGVNGPLAVNMRSLVALYNEISKPHPQSYFPPSRPIPMDTSESTDKLRPKMLGIPEEWFNRAQPAVQKLCRAMIDRLVTQKGYTVVPISIPFTQEGQIAHAITLLTDAATLITDNKGVSPPNRILLALGRTTPASDYQLAQKLRHVLMQHLAWLWQQHPGMIIMTPTTANAGWPIRNESELAYGISDGDETMRSMEYVWMANYCGVPSISVPAGFAPPVRTGSGANQGEVPVGLMGMGEWCSEENLIQFGFDAEEVGQHLRRSPPTWVDVVAKAKKLKEARVSSNTAEGHVNGIL